jgi:proteic killer suppression protein
MEVEFGDEDLDRLEIDIQFTAGFSREIVKAFRKALQGIRACADERDFYSRKGWHFEKLEGSRAGQRSIRLNKQWRLILEICDGAKNKKTVRVLQIEDYH